MRPQLKVFLLAATIGFLIFGCGQNIHESTYTISGKVIGMAAVTITITGDTSKTTVTNSDGSFSFPGLVDGSYVVTPSKSGHAFGPVYRNVALSGADSPDANFAVSDQDKYSISGTILGVGDVQIGLSGASSETIDTQADGYYAFRNLNCGDYVLTPAKSGYEFYPSARTVNISNESRTGDSFIATPGGTYSISGTVTGADTVVMLLEGAASAATMTNLDGHYAFSNLSNGNYTVTPVEPGYDFDPAARNITINNQSCANNNFAASSTSTYSISGTVLGADYAAVALTGDASKATTTNAVGYYVFSGLSDGNYVLTPAKPGYEFQPVSRALSVSGESVSGNNFVASTLSCYSISGYVLGADAVIMTLSGASSATTQTGLGGFYAFDDLASGNYAVTPAKTDYDFYPTSAAITITTQSSAGNNFTASQIGQYSISGNIVGLFPSNVVVKLTGAATAVFTTEADGHYAFYNLTNGEYNVAPVPVKYLFYVPSSKTITINGSGSADNDFVQL